MMNAFVHYKALHCMICRLVKGETTAVGLNIFAAATGGCIFYKNGCDEPILGIVDCILHLASILVVVTPCTTPNSGN
jgi:hypothetical protein